MMSWMDTCACTDEPLHCSPGTITALLTFYTPKQNDFGVNKMKMKFCKKKKKIPIPLYH